MKQMVAKRIEVFVNSPYLYSRTIQTFKFTNKPGDNMCVVSPYCIVLAGNDVVAFFHNKSVDMGFSVKVNKPKGHIRNSRKNFLKAIEAQIKESFFNVFDKHSSVAELDKDSEEMDQVTLINERKLTPDDIVVHHTEHAIFNRDRTIIHPIYFISLPGNEMVTKISTGGFPEAKRLNWIDLATGMVNRQYYYNSNVTTVMGLIGRGDLQLPLDYAIN